MNKSNEIDFVTLFKSKTIERKKTETSRQNKTGAVKTKQSKTSMMRSSLKNNLR